MKRKLRKFVAFSDLFTALDYRIKNLVEAHNIDELPERIREDYISKLDEVEGFKQYLKDLRRGKRK